MAAERESTDVAALSAGVLAVVVALFLAPGEYGLLNLAISVALMLIISGYLLPHTRTPWQSVALAAVVGLTIMPAIGYLGEAYWAPQHIRVLIGNYQWTCGIDPCSGTEHESRVPQWTLVSGGVFVSLVTLSIDRVVQRRRKHH